MQTYAYSNGSANIVKLWYSHSRLGTVDFLTDNVNGGVISYVTYDDWGAPTSKATVKMGVRELDLVMQYTVHPYVQVLGVYFAQARMYNAADRRFIAVDEAKDGDNWYTYCRDNPLGLIDPFGYWAIGDSEYKYEQQVKLLALTIAYINASDPSTKVLIENEAKKVRASAIKGDTAMPISIALDNHLKTNKTISYTDMVRLMAMFRIRFIGSGANFSSYRLHVGIENENLLNIENPTGSPFSGGDQSWFDSAIKQNTGCGSISIINMVYYYYLRFSCHESADYIIKQQDYMDMYNKYFGGLIGYSPLVMTATGYEAKLNEIYLAEIKINNLQSSTATNYYTSSDEALGMVILSLMKNNPVALQSWQNFDPGVTEFHWVTITAADINPFDFVASTVSFSTWGQFRDGASAYVWSSVWERPSMGFEAILEKASIVFLGW